GTNVVLVSASSTFTPAFGAASFATHQRAAGSHALELLSDEAAFDVDTHGDLELLGRGVVPARLRPFVPLGAHAEPSSGPTCRNGPAWGPQSRAAAEPRF